MHPKVSQAIRELDAAVMSSDEFINARAIVTLQGYLDRWNNALLAHRDTLKELQALDEEYELNRP